MTAEKVFSICNTLALLGWLILIIAGGSRVRRAATLASGVILPLMLSLVYCLLLAIHWGESTGGFGTLGAVAALFSNHWLLLAGWIHYLAFDLFIGAWQVRDAQAHEISHWFTVPCLLLTFLFGPAGLLLYFAVRGARTRTIAIGA